jgi:hypothetical protein
VSASSKECKQINKIGTIGKDVQRILVGEIYPAIRTIGCLIGGFDLTADKLYRDVACSSSSDYLLGSIGIGGVLPFGGLAPRSCEYEERVDVGVLGRGKKG